MSYSWDTAAGPRLDVGYGLDFQTIPDPLAIFRKDILDVLQAPGLASLANGLREIAQPQIELALLGPAQFVQLGQFSTHFIGSDGAEMLDLFHDKYPHSGHRVAQGRLQGA